MQRLITYDNAAAHGCWREVAADILVIPFWNTDFCADIIRAAELVDEFKPYATRCQKQRRARAGSPHQPHQPEIRREL